MQMQVLDIIQSAAFKAGIIPSFNPDEIPGDVVSAGRNILMNEIIPGLNCDRTIDITVTSRVYQPKDGIIVLTPLRQPVDNFEIIGYTKYTAQELIRGEFSHWIEELKRLRPLWIYDDNDGNTQTKNWPVDIMNTKRSAAIWTSDMQLVYGTPTEVNIMPEVNIDFPPMRIDTVLDDDSRIKYEYVYREEFDQILNVMLPGVFTVEEYDDKLILLVKGTNRPKRLIMPVPLQIVDADNERSGTITAPEKFRRYLIDATAVSLAIVYGVTTVDMMKEQAHQSYELLKKNKTQPLHKMNVTEEIQDKLRRGRRFYANF